MSNIGTGTAGTVLQAAGAGISPKFSTAAYPLTAGTTGKILISDGSNIVSSTPTYPNAASTALKHIKSDGTNFVTTTVTYPDASVTAGKVIVSDGTNYIASTPTFPNASATTRKIIVSDGTNWTASTETWAVPGSTGNLLASNGTNWTATLAPSVTSITLGGGTALSTYVVGTFTPVLRFGGASVGITYSVQSGFYTQIGDIVHFSFYIALSAKGSSTGAATISGFPVSTGTNGSYYSNNLTSFFAVTLTAGYTYGFVKMQASTQIGDLFATGSAQTTILAITDAMCGSQPTFACTGFYKTN